MTPTDETPEGPTSGAEDLRAELSRIDEELAELRRQVREIRSQLADEGPVDAADRAAAMSQAEELEALSVPLERRREAVRVKIGGTS